MSSSSQVGVSGGWAAMSCHQRWSVSRSKPVVVVSNVFPGAAEHGLAAARAAVRSVLGLGAPHRVNLPWLMMIRSFFPATIVEPGILNVH